jgi:hypothetical protein
MAILHAITGLLRDGRFTRSPTTALGAREGQGEEGEEQVRAALHLRSAQRLWNGSIDLLDTLGERYLRDARGIRDISLHLPNILRFHPAVWHSGGAVHAPAMLAAVVDANGEQRALHRSWIDQTTGRLAAFAPPKMTLCPTGGCSVHLGTATDTVAITEGIETGLSLAQLTGMPVWAALSTSGMRAIILSPHIRDVVIGADHDEPGIAAANVLRSRLLAEGRRARVIMPKVEGEDFNDPLKRAHGGVH